MIVTACTGVHHQPNQYLLPSDILAICLSISHHLLVCVGVCADSPHDCCCLQDALTAFLEDQAVQRRRPVVKDAAMAKWCGQEATRLASLGYSTAPDSTKQVFTSTQDQVLQAAAKRFAAKQHPPLPLQDRCETDALDTQGSDLQAVLADIRGRQLALEDTARRVYDVFRAVRQVRVAG